MNEESRRLLDALSRNKDIIQHTVEFGTIYDQYYVLKRLNDGADPNSTYPDGTKVISQAIKNLELARNKIFEEEELRIKLTEEYFKNLNIIGVLLSKGAILSEPDETKLDRNVDTHMASYLKNKKLDTPLAKELLMFYIFWSNPPKIKDGQYIEGRALRDVGEYQGTVKPKSKGGRTKQNNKSKRRVNKNRSMRKNKQNK